MHPPLNCHKIVPFPAQDMVSPPLSLSNDSSTHNPLKVQQLLQTRKNTRTAACEDAASVQPKLPVTDAAVLLPCACEDAERLQAKTEELPASTGYFYGTSSQIKVEGSASLPTRQPQQLRHPPGNWTGEISQEIRFHHEETSTRRTSYTGSDGNLLRDQTSEELVHEQGVCRRRHQCAFESEKKKVKGLLAVRDIRATAEAAVKAAVASQANPFPYFSYAHGERAAGYTHRTHGPADTKACTSNLLRSLSADVTEKSSPAQASSESHPREGQLGIAGNQKLRRRDFWTATGNVCKSPSFLKKPSQLAERSRFTNRAVPSVKEAKRKGQREKKEEETNLKCEEEQKCVSERKVLLGNCLAESAPFQNEHIFPARKNSLQPCHAQWRVRSGQSPVAFSCIKSKQTITRPTSPSLEFPGAAELPRRAEYYCSNPHLLSRNLESEPHILVRSYRTFQQDCARHWGLRKPDGGAEAKPEQNARQIFVQEQDQTVPGDACLRPNVESSSSGSQCEGASRGIQKQPSSVVGHSPGLPLVSNTQPLSEERRHHAGKNGSNEKHNPAANEHLSASRARDTASRVSRRNPQEPREVSDAPKDTHPVLPHRLLLKRLLGSGAMGHVYLVELDKRPYAVKIALQSDPAACMYLKQGWRNLVHLEKIYQRHQRQAAKQSKRPSANCSYLIDAERKDELRYTSPSATSQKAAQVWGRQYPNSGRTTSEEGRPHPHQPNAKDGRKAKHFIERGLLGRCRESMRKESDSGLSDKNLFATIQAEQSGTQHDGGQESLSLHPNNRGGETTSQDSKEAIAEEETLASLKSSKYSKNALPVPPHDSTVVSSLRQMFGVCRKPGEHYPEKSPTSSGEVANHDKVVEADKRERYFCRPVAFLEGEWFRFEALEQETTATPTVAAKLTNTRLLRLQRNSAEQKLPTRELLAQRAKAGEGTAASFASYSSLTSPTSRKHKQGCQVAGEQAATCGPVRIPVCAYIMEYIPNACQLTAVIWNLHRCLDPSHSLRRECHDSLVAQRLVEIGLCVAEAHKYIAAEAGLYSFDFNPKNILVCVLPGGERDTSPRAAATSAKKVILPSDSSASPPPAGRVVRSGTRAGRRQKEEAKTLCNAAPLRCVALPAKQQLQPQFKRQQQQQQMQLRMLQQHAQQHQTREQQGHINLSPADITRLVLCDPRVHFRVVAIDLDCSLQAPFTSSAGLSSTADVITSSSSSLPQTEDALGPLLDWSCGRRVVYSCPHVSSITAAYIVAVLAKNKGEGQFTRSGLSEAAAHAALCCRIDSEDNFLHYLWAPSGKGTSRDLEDKEQVKTPLEENECVFKVDSTETFLSRPRRAEQPTVGISYSAEHVSCEVDNQQLEASTSRTQPKETRATQQGGHGLVDVETELSFFPNSCIPAEVSTPNHAPAQKRPAPAPTELPDSSLLCAYPASCTSPTEHKIPSPSSAVPSRGDSSPKLISASNEQLAAGESRDRTGERTPCLKPQPLPSGDSSKRSWKGQLNGIMRETVDGSAAVRTTECSSSARSKNKEGIWPCVETEDKCATVWPGATSGDKGNINAKKNVFEACSCSCTLHASNIAAPRPLAIPTGQPSTCVQRQLRLPCFLYPRRGAKTPRGICQREYNNYGVRLVGQHVNLQLLSFILCELLDFRSLHVVVLQRFGLELRALHLPTGICQMFSEQDQIISCLCFSALTRMTSAVVPPLRFSSLASAKLSPAGLLHLFLPEPFCLTQHCSAVPLPFDGKAPVPVCACQQILKLHHGSRAFGSSQHGKANGTDEKRRERGDAVTANKSGYLAPSTSEKCSTAGPAAHQLLLKDSALVSSAVNCPAVLLLQKQNTEGDVLLLPGAAAEGRSCISLLKGCTGINNSQNISTTTKANSVNGTSFAATTWRTCMEQQGRPDILNTGKGECHYCIQANSPRREAGKNEPAQEEDGDTQAIRNHPRNHSSLHVGNISLCMHRRRKDRLSRHEHVNQSQHLSSLAGICTAPITAGQTKMRLAARESAAPAAGTAAGLGTIGGSRALAPTLAARRGLGLRQKEQHSQNVESLRSGLGASDRPDACILSPAGTQQHHETWMKTGVKTQWQQEVKRLTEGSPFGAYIGSQHPDGVMHSYAAELHEAANVSEKARSRTGPTCPASLVMLRRHQQLQQEQAQQEQQQKVRRLTPEDISRMSVWDKVEQLPSLNPHDFLPPPHLFGPSCVQEVAALNAVLLQFLDPHPFFALQYSSSTSAFDSVIHALRQLRCRLVSLREDRYS